MTLLAKVFENCLVWTLKLFKLFESVLTLILLTWKIC